MEPAPQSQPDALSAGRRIYLGNLLYTIKPHDIEEVLAANGFGHFDKIHISIDPVSARNPGYCFVDFPDRATADRALASLNATVGGRPIRVGPCEPKKQRDRGWNHEGRFAFQRWGDWSANSGDGGVAVGRRDSKGIEQGPSGALNHFDDMAQGCEGRRLYVGGLGKMIDQSQNNREISELFAGFNPTAIGKRITPRESTRSMPGNHHYCFVDFKTREEAKAARRALNGRPITGGKLKVALAKDIPDKLVNHHADIGYGRRPHDGDSLGPKSSRSGSTAESNRSMASSDWRRKDKE